MDGSVKPSLNMIEAEELGSPTSAEEGRNPFESLILPQTTRVKQVWAVGGGKGGIGKSLLTSSLAITLARSGNKVVAVDLDLGGANLHTALGVDLPVQTLSDFFAKRVDNLNDCMVPTGIKDLNIISGAQDAVGVANFYRISGYDVSEIRAGGATRTELRYTLFWSQFGLASGSPDDDPRQLGYAEPPESTVITWNTGYREYTGGNPAAGKQDIVLFLGGSARPYDSKLLHERSWRVMP